MPSVNRYVAAFVFIAYTAFVVCVCYMTFGRQHEAIKEQAKPEIRHADKSVTLKKDPDAKLKVRAPSKPAGGRPLRSVEVTVKPTDENCKPLDLRFDVDEYADGPRVSVVTPDGEVIGGTDKPLADWIKPVSRPLAIGVFKDHEEIGATVDRDFGNLRIGASVGEETRQVRILWKIK